MKLMDIFATARKQKASKVFINPGDTERLLPYKPLPVIDKPLSLGRGGGLDWYEDATVPLGSFRVA